MINTKISEKISDVRQKTHDGVDKVMDTVVSIEKSGEKKIVHLKDKAAKGIVRLKEKATMIKEKVDDHIQKEPEKMVVIAAGTGAAVSAALTEAIKEN